MLTEAQIALKKHCSPNSTLLIASSGGIDSMVLSHLTASLGYKIHLAHVNFQLRGEEAYRDQNFVKSWADARAIPFHTTEVNTKEYAHAHGVSTQIAARQLRYSWLEQTRQACGADFLLMAHHLNDTLETSIFHLAKGGGISGISGIPIQTKAIIRPLIHHSRDEIRQYAAKYDISWIEDSSNQELVYHRNFIRHQVIPLLKEINPSLEQTAKQTYQRLRQSQGIIQMQAQKIWNAGMPTTEGGWRFPIYPLLALPIGQPVLLHELLRTYGFNYTQSEQLSEALAQAGSTFYSATHECYVARDCLYITPIRSHQLKDRRPMPILGDRGWIKVPQGTLTWEESQHLPKPFPPPTAEAWFDKNALRDPLYLRPFHTGDRIKPFGMKGSKLVSDLLNEAGYPPEKRKQTLLLCAEETILWVVGLRTAHKATVSPQTHTAIRFCWKAAN